MKRAFVGLCSVRDPGATLVAHSWGDGDQGSVLFRVTEPERRSLEAVNEQSTLTSIPRKATTVVLGEEDVRTLFNWLGARLHGA